MPQYKNRDWANCQYIKLEKDVLICTYYNERCDSVINCIQEEEQEAFIERDHLLELKG